MLFWNNRPFLLVKPFHAVQVHCSWAEHVFSCSQTKCPREYKNARFKFHTQPLRNMKKLSRRRRRYCLATKTGRLYPALQNFTCRSGSSIDGRATELTFHRALRLLQINSVRTWNGFVSHPRSRFHNHNFKAPSTQLFLARETVRHYGSPPTTV